MKKTILLLVLAVAFSPIKAISFETYGDYNEYDEYDSESIKENLIKKYGADEGADVRVYDKEEGIYKYVRIESVYIYNNYLLFEGSDLRTGITKEYEAEDIQ